MLRPNFVSWSSRLTRQWWFAFGLAAMAATPLLALQRQQALSLSVPDGLSFKYLAYTPPGYDAGAPGRWPLMIFLHGAGERGADVERVAANGPPMLIERGRDFPCVVISPLCPGSWWEPVYLQGFVVEVAKKYRVDPDRIYVTGLSMGGSGTWDLAQYFPDYYAAAVPLCGAGQPLLAYKLRDLPVWAFHGALDTTMPVRYTEDMVTAIRQAGGDPKATIYPDLGHDVWTITYVNDALYTWLFAQSRSLLRSAPSIFTQPRGYAAEPGGGAVFSVAVMGSPSPDIQWQRLRAGSATWENLAEGGNYHGVRADTLTVNPSSAGMAGDQFRAVVSNPSGTVTTAAVTLTLSSAGPLQYPAGIALDASGSIFVADSAANTIRKISRTGTVGTFAGAAGTAGSADGTGAAARFNQPGAITADRDGNLYVADTGNSTIRKITPAGIVTTLAGSASSRGSQDGAAGSATFNSPAGIVVDAAGNVFVADTFNATIRQLTPTGVVSTLAGSPLNRGDQDGTGAAARFNFPHGLAVDPAGNLYVADTYNNTVRKISATGVVTTLAGMPGINGVADGTGLGALFNQPGGIAVDASGGLVVADTGNSTVRKLTTSGAVTTLAGLGGVAGSANGVKDAAFFNQPGSLAIDGTGTIFVADTGNAIIRRIAPDGTVTTMALSEEVTTTSGGGSTVPSSTTTPTTTTTPSANSSAGGGGAIDAWLVAALALVGLARWSRWCRGRRGVAA